MKFQVTQSHIDAANKWLAGYHNRPMTAEQFVSEADHRRTCNCPASRALLEHTGLKLGQVITNPLSVNIDGKGYRTTGALNTQINRWDCTGKFEPGEYEIVPNFRMAD